MKGKIKHCLLLLRIGNGVKGQLVNTDFHGLFSYVILMDQSNWQ